MSAVRWIVLTAVALLQGCALRSGVWPGTSAGDVWNNPRDWALARNDETTCSVRRAGFDVGPGLDVHYRLGGEHGYVQLKRRVSVPGGNARPLTFLAKARGGGDLEVKFVDADGSVYGGTAPLADAFQEWRRVNAFQQDLEYWWGGDRAFGDLAEVHLAVSGKGSGVVQLAEIGFGEAGMKSSFTKDPAQAGPNGPFYVPSTAPQIDPDADLPGIGFRQRRASELTPEDPRVLEWLKTLQDVSSPGRQVLPTSEDNECQTFNNMLVAMAYLVKDERERAERILDFYAAATNRANSDPKLQNFYYKGEARGFFQLVSLNATPDVPAFHAQDSDRWMGDMAWMIMAYTSYERKYASDRYHGIVALLRDLLVSWFRESDEVPGGGYVQHGWRKGDRKLHEDTGHPEGNIDCRAVFELLGEHELARKIDRWLEPELRGDSLPLDLYTWRVLAYGGKDGACLEIPDRDLRYRKTLTVNGVPVSGPYHSAKPSITNIWLDGLGHLSCAYAAAGDLERSWFYANQYDAFLMDSSLGGKSTRTLPYTANEQGGFARDQSKGNISAAAWYIFAKNGFNPMQPMFPSQQETRRRSEDVAEAQAGEVRVRPLR